MLLVLAVVVLVAVGAVVVQQRRSRSLRPAVPGGTRRDYFGDRMPRPDSTH